MDYHDPVSSWSHLLMAFWMIFVCMFLLKITAKHRRQQRAGIAIYSLTVVLLYFMSGLFHGLNHPSPEVRRLWQLLDQTAIFWLIFGSNVPICVYVLSNRVRNRILGLLFAIAFGGTLYLWLMPKPPHEVLIGIYVGMGISSMLPLRSYYRRLGRNGLVWIFLLAFLYVIGAVFEGIRWPVIVPGWLGPHEVLHLCDVAGTIAHLRLLMINVIPKHRSFRELKAVRG